MHILLTPSEVNLIATNTDNDYRPRLWFSSGENTYEIKLSTGDLIQLAEKAKQLQEMGYTD